MKNSAKNNLNKKFHWSFFRVFFIAEMIIAVLLLSLLIWVQTQTVQSYSIAQLEQIAQKADFLHGTLESVSRQLLADRDIFAVLTATEVDRLQEFRASQRLRAIQSGYPHIRYVGFYNSITDRFQCNACVASGDDFGADFFYEMLDGRRFICIRRTIGIQYAIQPTHSITVYTFVFAMHSSGYGSPQGFIVLDVDADHLDNVVGSIRRQGRYQQVVFIDDAGYVVATQTAQRYDARFFDTDPYHLDLSYLNQMPFGASGHMFYRGWMITYAYAPQMNWTIINMIPYHYILRDLVPIVLLALLLLVCSLAFGYKFSKRESNALYIPIGNLYAKVDQLEQGLINAYNLSKNQYLNYLFEGKISKIAPQTHVYERLNIQLDSPYYGVILIECGPKEGFDETLFTSPYVLERIMSEATGKFYGLEFSRFNENIFVALIYMEENSFKPEFAEGLKEVIKAMEAECDAEATICIGDICDTWQNINLPFEQAMIALKSRPLHATGKVFHYQEKTAHIRADQYFNDLHKKFSEYIRTGDIEACKADFDTALLSMEDASFEMVKIYFQHISLSVLDDFDMYFNKDDESTRALLSLLEQTGENISSLRQSVISFVGAMAHRFDVMRKTGGKDAIKQVIKYVDDHFSEQDLSLSSLSDQVYLTPAYLGKAFAEYNGMNFTDYLARKRMQKAAELLENTELTVQKISERVGIISTNYFYSLFKKHYHMTPMHYRNSMQNNRPFQNNASFQQNNTPFQNNKPFQQNNTPFNETSGGACPPTPPAGDSSSPDP